MLTRASSSSSITPSASKKRKTASEAADTDDPPPPPSPSTSFFFADGNVLLQVEATLFKVHRGVLEKAEVFADTLLVGGHLGGEEAGGIPTIKLDDSKEDWEVFLRALYDGLSFSKKLPTLLETRSMLLPADKYNHTSVLESATAAFIARSTYELNVADAGRYSFDSDPYGQDLHYGPETDEADRALIALQEEFSLDRSSARWIHNRLALSSPMRAKFIRCYSGGVAEVDKQPRWRPVAMSNQTRQSILLRADAFAQLAAVTMSYNFTTLHSPKCVEGSACRRVLDESMGTMYKYLARQLSYETVVNSCLKFVGDESDEVEKATAKDCMVKIRTFWEAKQKELDAEKEKDFDP